MVVPIGLQCFLLKPSSLLGIALAKKVPTLCLFIYYPNLKSVRNDVGDLLIIIYIFFIVIPFYADIM